VTQYFFRRILLMIPTFLGITLLVFTLTRLVPGGPIERMMTEMQMAQGDTATALAGPERGGVLSSAQLAQLEAYYGFDQSIPEAYLNWLGRVLQLDLGMSTRYHEPVWNIIADRLPISLYYGLVTLILTYAISIPLGIAKALRHGQRFDHVSSTIVFVGYAIPGYVLAIALLTTFAAQLDWFPLGGFTSERFEELSGFGQVKDIIWHSILPLLAYLLGSFAVMTFMMKNALMDQLAADYVRTALAKGLSFSDAIRKHAVRNALIPLATHFGNNISVILSGSFLIETIFNINGFGLLGYESLLERDYPVVMGILVISSLLFLIGNILSDLCVAWVDPRVRFG
jgi:microcin C transport system permease protein